MGERILLVSPVVPALTGNGLAMRAGMTLRALSQVGQVTLLVDEQYSSLDRRGLDPELAFMCASVVIRRRGAEIDLVDPLNGRFDRVHCFRLSTVEGAAPWFSDAGEIHVDFDDLESRTRLRIAGLLRARGRHREAEREERNAAMALDAEVRALGQFDRVYLAGATDIDHVPFCGRAEVRVLPNVIDAVENWQPNAEDTDRFTALFVGTLTYFPNEDAIQYFCDEVLPRLRDGAAREFRVQIVGLAPPAIRALGTLPNVDVKGFVPDLSPSYRSAGAMIVPLRAGGGSRIKVLEAFAHRVPVISTSIGVEGLAVEAGTTCLVADHPDDFAASCLALMNNLALRDLLVTSAFRFVRENHSLAAATDALR